MIGDLRCDLILQCSRLEVDEMLTQHGWILRILGFRITRKMITVGCVSLLLVIAVTQSVSADNEATPQLADKVGETKKVRAPFVKVDTDGDSTTKVRAPFVKVDTDGSNGAKKVRAPFVKIDRVGDQVHVRAPFVNKWMSAEEYDRKKQQEQEEERQKELKEQSKDQEKSND